MTTSDAARQRRDRRATAPAFRTALCLSAFALLSGIASPGKAAPIRIGLEPGAVLFLRVPQSDRFSPGALVGLKAEYLPLSRLSVMVGFSTLVVPASEGDPGASYNLMGGVRIRPLARTVHDRRWASGLFVDAVAGYVRTENLNRFGLEAGAGYEFSVHRMWRLGPFVRYYYVLQPGGRPDVDPRDAHGLWMGVSVSFDFAPRPVAQRRKGCVDRDRDKICDFEDKCPGKAEDFDGFEDTDGCPDSDNDRDTVPDKKDRCPGTDKDKADNFVRTREDPDEFEDDDGCPDPDNDKDGIPDLDDKCPNRKEDQDGFEDKDGCPDNDNDRDTVVDGKDKCPGTDVDRQNNFARVKEDLDGFEDGDGCPDPDNDKDGFPDPKDSCPDHPETLNCYKDNDGCPDDILHITDKVLFRTDSARLKPGAKSMLKHLAARVLGDPSILRLRVEGHCDVRGRLTYNDKLSIRRARKVMKFVIRQGIDPRRIEAAGYGERCPAAAKHLRNRRVVFRIVCPRGPGATVNLVKSCPPAAVLRKSAPSAGKPRPGTRKGRSKTGR